MKEKVVLAYSWGIDTSIIIPWLKENYDIDVIAVCTNVDQDDDMEQIHEKAIASGAIKAKAKYEGRYLLGTALARPIIAKISRYSL